MPAIARKSGADTVATGHGCDSTTVTQAGSSNVFVNGIGACRKGDAIQIHTIPSGKSCVPHTAVINIGSNSVFVNGISVARLGDYTDNGKLTSGSPNVYAGTGTFNLTTEDGNQIITEDGFIYAGDY